jgi:hypothetical protein
VSVSGVISSDHSNIGYQQIGGDVTCMSRSREERRHALHVYQKAEIERFPRKCGRELKEDYDAKLIGIWKATRIEIAEETKKIHEHLFKVYSETYTKAAEEHSKLEEQKVKLKGEFERLLQLRKAVNSDIERFANMVTTTTVRGDNEDAVEPALPYDSRLLEFQRAPILGVQTG